MDSPPVPADISMLSQRVEKLEQELKELREVVNQLSRQTIGSMLVG